MGDFARLTASGHFGDCSFRAAMNAEPSLTSVARVKKGMSASIIEAGILAMGHGLDAENLCRDFIFDRMEEKFSAPLDYGYSGLVDGLLNLGHRLRLVEQTLHWKKPLLSLNPLPPPRITETHYEIFFEEGFLRFQISEKSTAWLTLFWIYPPFRRQGIGSRKFCELSDALEVSGIETQYGRPAPTRLERRIELDAPALMKMYLQTGRFQRVGNGEWIVRRKATSELLRINDGRSVPN